MTFRCCPRRWARWRLASACCCRRPRSPVFGDGSSSPLLNSRDEGDTDNAAIMMCDKRFLNVIMLGVGFMFVFTAFQTMGNIEKTVLDSVKAEDPTYHGDGYTSLAIIYGMLAIGNWIAPSVIGIGGPRLAMVIGAITYLFFIVTFFFPETWLLYVASAIIGLGASVIWTGQGNYLTLNSDATTMSTNSGIFWAMLQCSMLIGNFFVFMVFQGKDIIDASMRQLIFSVLTGVTAVGVIILIFLRPAVSKDGELVAKRSMGPIQAFREAIAMLAKKEMLLLCVTFFYTGLELSFYSGVYSPSIGFTLNIKGSKELVGLSGIFIGIGEIAGGLLFGLLGKKTTRWGRDPIVILGLIVHLISFLLIFLNLPNPSPLGDTHEDAVITSNAILAILCSALLGFADACYNTQIYTAIGIIFPDSSAPAFAIFKFTQSVAAACGFFYSSQIGLYAQLLILLVTSILGTATFCIVEFLIRRRHRIAMRYDTAASEKSEP